MKTLAEIRASLGKSGDIFTDQEIAEMAVRAYGSRYKDPSVVYKKLGYDPEQDFTRGASMAWEGLKGSAKGGVAALASAVGATGLRDRMRESAQENQLKAYQLSRDTDRIENFTKDPLSWLASGAGQVGVYALPSVISGGGAAGLTALAGGSRAAMALAGAGGAFGANYVPATGGIYNELMDQGRDEPGRAALFGAGVAALDTAAEAIPFLKPMMKGGALRRAGQGAAIQAPVDTTTEVAQTGIERAGAYKDLLSEEARSEYYNAAALSVLGGGAFGAAGGAFDTRAAKLEQAERLRIMAEQAAAEQKTAEANRLMALRARALAEAEQISEQSGQVTRQQLESMYGVPPPLAGRARAARQADLNATFARGSGVPVVSADGTERELTENEYQLVQMDLGHLIDPPGAPSRAEEIAQAKAKFEANKAAASDALIEKDADGNPVVAVKTREVNTFLGLQTLANAGLVTPDFIREQIETIREAIKNNDTKSLAAIDREVKKLVKEAGDRAQPNVPGTPAVAPGAVPAGGADAAGGGGAVGPVGPAAQQSVPVLDGGAVTPVGGSGALAPVAVGAGPRRDSGAVAQRLSAGVAAPRMSKREMEQGVNQWFSDFNRRRLEALAEAREDVDIDALRDDPDALEATLESLRVDAEKRGLLLDPNKPVVVMDGSGKKQTKTAREVMMSMMAADPGHAVLYQGVMQASLGEPLTLDQLALAHQQATGAAKPLTKERIRQILGQYGITQEVVDKAFAENPDTVTREELGVDDTGQLAGFREADTLGEASAEGLVQAEALTGPEKKLAAIANQLLQGPVLPAPYKGETVPQLLERAQTQRRAEIAEQLRELVAEGENDPKIARAVAQMAASAGIAAEQLTGPAPAKKTAVTRAVAPKEEAEKILSRAVATLKQSRDKEVVKTATEGVMSAEEREAIVARNAAIQAENERLLAQAEADAAARREADRPRREKARELQKQRDEEAARKAAERKREAELAEARREADIKLATKSVGIWSPTPEEQRAEFGDEAVNDAKEYWDDKRDDNDPAWDQLPGNVQVEFIDAMMQWDKVVLDDAGLFERYQQLMEHAVGFVLGKDRVSRMVLTATAKFKRWFGDSKIVDVDGKPLVMYHGTSKDFTVFKPAGEANAIFLSPSPSFASGFTKMYTADETASPNIMPLYVRAERPFDPQVRSHVAAVMRRISDAAIADNKQLQRMLDSDGVEAQRQELEQWLRTPHNNKHWQFLESPVVQAAIRAEGFDSFYVHESGTRNIAVYDSTQVKSATGNNGEFNPNDADVRYSAEEGRIPRLDEVEFLDWDDISMTEAGTDLEFSLDRLGLSHLTSYVDVWVIAQNPKDKTLADGAAWSHNGKTYVYTKHPRGKLARFVLSHELGHGVDMASEGGIYSADPRMAMRSQTEPAGEVARELYDLWSSGSELGKGLAYPFDTDLTEMDGEVAQSEVFAQLFAMFLDPSTREALYDEAPTAAYFMEDVLEDLRKLGPARPASTTREQLRQRGLHFDRTVGRSPVQRGAEGPADARNARRYTAPRDVRDGAGDDRGASGGGGRRVPPGGQTRGVPQDGGPSREAVDATLGRLNALRSRSPAWSRGLWSRVMDMAKKGMPYLMTNFQIAQSYAAKLPGIRQFVEVSDRMRVEAQTLQIKFDDLAQKWAALDADVQKRLNKVAMDSTMLEMFADGDDYLGKGSKRHEHVNPTDENNAKYAKLRADFKALPADAQRVYKEAYELADLAQEDMVAAMEQLQKDYGIPVKKVKRVPGPYFPLMRFGDYIAIGESESLQALREQLKAADTPEAKEAVQTMIDSMERSAEHYIVSAHETRGDMELAVKGYEQAGMKTRMSMADQRLGSLPARNVQATIATLAAAASKGFDGDVKEQIERGIANAMLKALPEMHALQRQAERRGIAGAEPDMLRAVAAYGRQVSFYTARLKHAKAQTDALMRVKDEARGDVDLMYVHRELEKRGALNMEYKETPLQDMLGTAGYVWFLGASPTYWAMNIAQPWLVTAPVLAGEFGLGATTKHMSRATREAVQILAAARYDKQTGKFNLWSGINPETVPGESVNDDRRALREMIRRGVIDERTTFELAQFAAGGANNPMVKFANGVGWGAQQIELVNRTATALAAFRLAREAQAKDPDVQGLSDEEKFKAAVDKAYQVTLNTHMDFSQENTARFMREGGGVPMAKLIFQFRRYQQAMLWLIGHNIGKLSNAKERKAAQGTLAYLTLTSTLVGGVMGIPFIGTAMFLSNLIADDDDERGPVEVRLRNLIADTVGNGALGDVVAKGVPAAFGMNLGERMSLGNIAALYPRLEMGRTANETVGNVATAVAGPVLGGMSVQMVDAWMLAANGDLYRAVERATPKFVADVMKAYRYQTDGMLDRKGEQILGPEEIGEWNTLIRALGTQSMQEADYYQASAAKREVETAIKDRKSQIGNKYRTALRRGDMAEVRKAIAEFNRDHPRSKITPKDEQAWRRAYREAQRNRNPNTGIKLDPQRDAEYSELMRFAR